MPRWSKDGRPESSSSSRDASLALQGHGTREAAELGEVDDLLGLPAGVVGQPDIGDLAGAHGVVEEAPQRWRSTAQPLRPGVRYSMVTSPPRCFISARPCAGRTR